MNGNGKDTFFVGTIDEAMDKKIGKSESVGVDLALLTLCDHVIISHGTFGLWAAFLSSLENDHIMAHDLPESKEGKKEEVDEIKAMKKANFPNFIFM